jgi:hypothetical protein
MPAVNITSMTVIFIITGMCLCIFGFKIYRALVAILIMMITSIGVIILLSATETKIVVLTMFTIAGIVLALASFQWKKLGAYIITGFIISSILYQLTGKMAVSLIIGYFAALIAIPYPVYSTILSTSLYGSALAVSYIIPELIISNIYSEFITLVLFCIGVFFQILTNQNQHVITDSGEILKFTRKDKPEGI